MEFEAEIKADNAKIEAFNESMVAAHWRQKPLLKSAVFPKENVISGEGILTIPAGKEKSSSIKLTLLHIICLLIMMLTNYSLS